MPFPSGSIPLTGAIGVGSSADTFGTHYDHLGIGGYRSVADQSTMTSIPSSRRTKGMLVRNNTNGKIYTYISNDGTNDNTVTNATDSGYSSVSTGWKELQLGSASSGTITSVTIDADSPISVVTDGSTSTDLVFTFSLDTIPTEKGGTNITTYAKGDLLYSSATNTLSKLTKPSATSLLQMNSSGDPSWITNTSFEVPITVSNGLTRSSNTFKLGGTLSENTTVAFANNKLSFTSTNSNGDTIFDFVSGSTTLLDVKSTGTSPNFFSTSNIPIPTANSTTTLKLSTLPLDATNISSNAGTTIVNHSSTTNITGLPTAEYSSGNAFTYTINQHTFTLPQKSGLQDNVGIGTQNSTINMFRYFLTNSIWKAASGGSGTGYDNGTWELARLYSTGLSSNTSSLSVSTRISQSGATFFTLANPGHRSVFRVLVGDRTIGQDVVTLGYDTVTFPTADTLGNITISSYSGQVLNFGVSANTFTSAGITGTPGATTSYFAISSGNESFLPDMGTSSTGPTANGVTLGNYVKSSTTTGIVGTPSRALNWRVRTFTPVASTNVLTSYNYGRQITLNMVAKSYPHYSNSKTLDSNNNGTNGYAYDFRQRWLLFPITPTPTANNNPSAGLNSPPTFYNSTTSLLDGSNTNDPIRAIDILSGPYSTTSPTSGSAPNPTEAVSKSSQVAVGISLGANEIPSAKVTIGKSTTLQAAMKLYVGVAPSSPEDGEIWLESNSNTGLKIRINGVTKTITLS